MKSYQNKSLLREYIREILSENDSYDASLAVDTGGTGRPYGAWGASGKDLINTFATPFTDVLKTTGAEAEKVVRRAKTLANVALVAVATTLIPFYNSEYSKIFEKERADLDKIKTKYKDVYARTEKALSGDAAVAAFFFSPEAYLTVYAAKKGPEALKNVIGILSGGTIKESNSRELTDGEKNLIKNFLNSPDGKNLKIIEKTMKNSLSSTLDQAVEKAKEIFDPKNLEGALGESKEKALAAIKNELSKQSDQDRKSVE